jgi:hypothetical protein
VEFFDHNLTQEGCKQLVYCKTGVEAARTCIDDLWKDRITRSSSGDWAQQALNPLGFGNLDLT